MIIKTWQHGDNKRENYPESITIFMQRDDGMESERVTATYSDEMRIEFKHLEVVDQYGKKHTWKPIEVRKDGKTKAYVPEDIPDRTTGTPVPPFENMTEEELEELFDIFGYGTPLYGMLGTGDQIPVWVWVCSGIGVLAIVLVLVTGRKKKKRS